MLLLEPFGSLPVQRSSRLREDRAVGGLLDQRVPKAVLGLGPAARLPDELEPLKLVQRVLRRGSEHAFEERQPERPAEGRGGGEDVVARRREAVDPREQELLDRRRDLHRDVVVEAVAARLADERARLEERADELLEVEGIPLGLAEHAGGDVVGERLGPHERVEQRGLRVARQGLERELAGQVRILAERQLAQAPGCVVALVPLGDRRAGPQPPRRGGRAARTAAPRSCRPSAGPRAPPRPAGRRQGGAARSRRPRRSGTGAPPGRAGPGAPRRPARASGREGRPGTGRSRRRVPGRVRRRCAAARPAAVARARRARRRATPAAGRGTASREAIHRRRRSGPRARAAEARLPRLRRGRASRRAGGSCRSPPRR